MYIIECAICQDPLSKSVNFTDSADDGASALPSQERTQAVALNCGHLFHRFCIDTWFSKNGIHTCPQCKNEQNGPTLGLYLNDGDNNNRNARRNSKLSNINNDYALAVSKLLTRAKEETASVENINLLCKFFDDLGEGVPEKNGNIAIGDYFRVLRDTLALLLVHLASNTRKRPGGLLDKINDLENNLEQSNNNYNNQMSENRRITKHLDDYKSHIESLKKEIKKR